MRIFSTEAVRGLEAALFFLTSLRLFGRFVLRCSHCRNTWSSMVSEVPSKWMGLCALEAGWFDQPLLMRGNNLMLKPLTQVYALQSFFNTFLPCPHLLLCHSHTGYIWRTSVLKRTARIWSSGPEFVKPVPFIP